MRTELVLEALQMAVDARGPGAGLIHHWGRGSQYASGVSQKLLHTHSIVCSISRKGS